MKIALTCPASLPATQFGGIMFLCIDIAKKLSNDGHALTIYTTDLDFANTTTFNKKLPRQEKIDNFFETPLIVAFLFNKFLLLIFISKADPLEKYFFFRSL